MMSRALACVHDVGGSQNEYGDVQPPKVTQPAILSLQNKLLKKFDKSIGPHWGICDVAFLVSFDEIFALLFPGDGARGILYFIIYYHPMHIITIYFELSLSSMLCYGLIIR